MFHRFHEILWAAALLLAAPLQTFAVDGDALANHVWIHGAEDCSKSVDPPIETFKFDEDTYILRQSKCVDFEAPFIYVFFGSDTVLIQDTGATQEAALFPLYDTILELIRGRSSDGGPPLEILVTHSHSHGDHKAADEQFEGR